MRNKMILAASLTLALASTSAAFAQTDKYDLTGGDHMYSYGAAQPAAAPTRTRAVRHYREEDRAMPMPTQTQSQSNVQYDRTGDHMYSFGPASK
jgi:hypothetical protein